VGLARVLRYKLPQQADPTQLQEVATKNYVDNLVSDIDVIKQRSFIFLFGGTGVPPTAGITAVNGSTSPFTTPTSFLKNISLLTLFGPNFFGTDLDKIIIHFTVLSNTVGTQQDLMLAGVRSYDANNIEIVMRRLDVPGGTWGANQEIFVTVSQLE